MSKIKERAGEVRTKIKLNDETHPFNPHTTTTRLKDNFIFLNAYENAFSPFRTYAVELILENGTPPGDYPLNGNPGNKIKLVYLPPNTNLLNHYADKFGNFHLTETATLERVIGSFDCVAISVNEEITAKANLDLGVVSFDQELRPCSTGILKGTLQDTSKANSENFVATQVVMEFVGGTGPNSFLQVIAKVKGAPEERQLHLHIPRARLGEHQLPITTNEDGTSALATLIYNGVHHATEGTINYQYDNVAQHFSGDLEFQANGGITFKDGKFDISGLIPPR
jgi:hypothetical protein